MMRNILIAIFILPLLLPGQVDHSEMIEESFDSPQAVTEMCLMCHEDAAQEIMNNIHWTWETEPIKVSGHEGLHRLGKKHVFNNFCIHIQSNWPRCTSCHIGYGWEDDSFDFSTEENVDCLVCHDLSGAYKKSPAGAGMPDTTVNLLKAAQSVGIPNRANCGNCHFFGGGGENVKHGDLDQGLLNPTQEYDVHMGADMLCQDCHNSEMHQISGKSVSNYASDENRVRCINCHDREAHTSKMLNNHTEKIACQTCHIPSFAKDKPTKLYWDWSTAGKDSTAPKDQYGQPTYHKKKGSFRWDKNVEPEYYWYNGTTGRYLLGDTFDPAKMLQLNEPLGGNDDPEALLYPFKVHRGKQIYDTENNYLIVPQLYGGYWKHFDWDQAAREGMQTVGLEYSGNYGFAETEMYWKINHMVTPAKSALRCNDCHGSADDKRIDWKALGYKGDQMYTKYRE